ncbi:MAG: immunoglobulin-like domain-containing protein [Marinobacter sp.]
MAVALNTSFTDPGATAEDAGDGSVTVTADCSSVDVASVGSYSCLYAATDSDTNVATAERQVEVTDPNAPTETCEQVTASPRAHVSSGRAYYAGGYYSAGGDDYLGAIPGG